MRKKIRFISADDQLLLQDGVRRLAESYADLEMIGAAGDGLEIVRKAKQLKPDVILLDIEMPKLNGLEALSLLQETVPVSRVVMFTVFDKESYVHRALAAGAVGYLLKTDSSDEVRDGIRAAAAGRLHLSPSLNQGMIRNLLSPNRTGPTPESAAYNRLSNREQQVFRLVIEGRTSKDIARILFLSPRTIEKHRSNMIHKLGLKDTAAMVRYAIKIGVVDPDLWH